ncbi:MAG: hypothetical protein ACLT2T_10420 [Bilophila wadsworthia]
MMRAMKQLGMTAAIIGAMSAAPVLAQEIPADASNFYKSESVTVRQVTFPNQYNMNIAGNLSAQESGSEDETRRDHRRASHGRGEGTERKPVRRQMAERGFVTLSVDLAFWGGSEANRAMPFHRPVPKPSAPADFLGTNLLWTVNGSGSSASAAAAVSPSAPPRSIPA